jgi:hypothetical protein
VPLERSPALDAVGGLDGKVDQPDPPQHRAPVTTELIDALAPMVIATLPWVAARIPPGPAAELVRSWQGQHRTSEFGPCRR